MCLRIFESGISQTYAALLNVTSTQTIKILLGRIVGVPRKEKSSKG